MPVSSSPNITLSGSVTRTSSVNEWDVKQIKKVLNRLGYYSPLETTGITGIPDEKLFTAIKKFQADQGLPVTGEVKPDDMTVSCLSEEAGKTPEGFYVWRTVDDNKVRKTHAIYKDTVRAWSDSPDPGQDYNCRCWAEPVKDIVIPDNASQKVKDAFDAVKYKLYFFDHTNLYLSARLLRHYLSKKGTDIYLSENAMDNFSVVTNAIKINQKRFEDSLVKDFRLPIKEKILVLKENNTIVFEDYWDVDRGKWDLENLINPDYDLSIGTSKIRSRATITAERKGKKIIINGEVIHRTKDDYDFIGGKDNPTNEYGFVRGDNIR